MPDQEYGVFTPKECQRIWKAVLSYERENVAGPIDIASERNLPIYYKNTSSESIQPYSILQVVDMFELETKNYVRVRKPIAWTGAVVGPFIFSRSGEVAPNEYGVAQYGPVYQVKYSDTLPDPNWRVGPVDNKWTVEKGSMYTVLGTDTIQTELIRVVDNHTPILGIADEELPANGEGEVVKKDPAIGDWVAGSVVYVARNPSATAIPEGSLVMLFPIDAKWAAVQIC